LITRIIGSQAVALPRGLDRGLARLSSVSLPVWKAPGWLKPAWLPADWAPPAVKAPAWLPISGLASAWRAASRHYPTWMPARPLLPGRVPQHTLVVGLGLVVVVAGSLGRQHTETALVQLGRLDDLVDEQLAGLSALESPIDLATYVVEPGDTLKSIANRTGISIATISGANRLNDPDFIKVGQPLLLPPANGTVHTIEPGETLSDVASRYGVDPLDLARANHLLAVPQAPLGGRFLLIPGLEPSLPKLAEGVRQGEAPRSTVSYVVKDGDTLQSLAQQFGVTVRTILVANDLDDPDLIDVGTELKVLPVSGVEHKVSSGETLADIAAAYRVDLGPIVDFNGLGDPNSLKVGAKLLIPGATARVYNAVGAAAPAPVASSGGGSVVATRGSGSSGGAASASSGSPAQARINVPAAGAAASAPSSGGLVGLAMKFLGYRYIFGGTSPAGFDCSGFVWYVHKLAGIDVSRGIWGQLNGGPRISRANLVPGDTVFFANTYMPGLSHVGIYLGGGQFVHAIDESSGVGISSLNSAYWAPRYIGATRLFH
jgi:cell wall-associated NlpC family hydrolase